ncbi:MAG: HlyD family type I secretion periplasmic adaptor subunit [Gammaproteobacteria bacterium]|nr:HlyD family type I secretion periplasmic adaptor subunit [Gammaproteobacteria bacterium]MBI5615691.1 HlyD family type I secretion periplasmic adaptor subunit [Gammaproteobacteria bacterium]
MKGRTLELEFLPAALEIEETPPLVMARVMLWAIMAFFILALAWSCIGKVDIVGVAPGKIVPSGRTKTIQPLERSVVAAIRVAEGQHVKAGEILVELDPTASLADRDRLVKERESVELDRARLATLIEAIENTSTATQGAAAKAIALNTLTRAPSRAAFAGLQGTIEATEVAREAAQLDQQFDEYQAAVTGIVDDISAKQAERQAIEARIAQLEATLPLITEEAEANRKLMGTGMVPRVKWLELERQRIEQQQERDVQRNQRRMLEATLRSLEQKLAVTAAQYRNRWMAELDDAETKRSAYGEELAKAERKVALQTLTAPLDGTVQQLAVHTVGGVVTEAQPLMLLVPDDSPIEVEAMVPNQDIGFVREGQEAVIKVETFNFTKYGFVRGNVVKVSHDAVADEKRGLNYIAHLSLDATTMNIDGNEVKLAPGMAVSAEVKMGTRKVIEFLLSPLLRYRQESGRER